MARLSRRQFLLSGGATVGAALLASCGARQGASQTATATVCGPEAQAPKVLVAYATRAGSTAGIAEALGTALCEAGLAADVRPVTGVTSLEGYDGLVLGSCIRFGRWMSEATEFVEKPLPGLDRIPTALFTVGFSAFKDNDEQALNMLRGNLEAKGEGLDLVATGLFAGVMDPDKLEIPWRWMMKAANLEIGDLRDWDAIGAWGLHVAERLQTK
jgi:menaquinone-dependent protoporphyrinogen oxidase